MDWAQREKRHKRAPRHRETIGPKSRSQCAIRVSVASSRDISLPRFADDEISEGGLASSGVTAACSGSSPRRALVRLCSVIATPIRMPAEIPRATVTSSSTAFENTTAGGYTGNTTSSCSRNCLVDISLPCDMPTTRAERARRFK